MKEWGPSFCKTHQRERKRERERRGRGRERQRKRNNKTEAERERSRWSLQKTLGTLLNKVAIPSSLSHTHKLKGRNCVQITNKREQMLPI